MYLSIVIPALNEADNILPTVEELRAVVRQIPDVRLAKIIVVDDHSGDNTFDLVAGAGLPDLVCLRLSRRSGSHVAIRAGLKETAADAVLCLSADGQDDASVLPLMLEKWRKGSKLVWALRRDREIESFYYRFCANLFYEILRWATKAAGQQVDLSRADFFLLDRAAVEAVNSCVERETSLFGLLSWIGFPQDTVDYQRRRRRHGQSKWGFWKAFAMAQTWITAFSNVPLKLMSLMGFWSVLLGLGYGLIIGFHAVVNRPIPGWSSLMSAIFFLGGIQMMMLGIVGEYLWHNLEESRRRPMFFIEKRSAEKS